MSEVWQRNLAVPYFTQRDNTYMCQQLAEKEEKATKDRPIAGKG